MHENIENRITELKEICLQIINLTETKAPYAYGYLTAIANGDVQSRSKYYGVSLSEAYDTQILYILENLKMWKGNDARHYKALLKEYQAYFKGKQNTGKLAENVNPMWQAIRGIGD